MYVCNFNMRKLMKLFRGRATIVEQEKPTLMHIATS